MEIQEEIQDTHHLLNTPETVDSNICQNCCLYLVGVLKLGFLKLGSNLPDSWVSRNLDFECTDLRSFR